MPPPQTKSKLEQSNKRANVYLSEQSLNITPHTSAIGVTVDCINLSKKMNTATFQLLSKAFEKHRLLVLKGQRLTVEQQISFSQMFGSLEEFPTPEDRAEGHKNVLRVTNIDQDSGNIKPVDDPAHRSFTLGTSTWHIDSSFRKIPSRASILHGLEIPEEGGDTIFADTTLAYEALSNDTRKQIEKLVVVHDFEESRKRHNLPPRPFNVSTRTPPVSHPLVVERPDRRRALFIGAHAAGIEDMPREKAHLLLDQLEKTATQRKFTYQHEWSSGDTVIYDNICVMHKAMAYNLAGSRRLLHRTTIAGTSPSKGVKGKLDE